MSKPIIPWIGGKRRLAKHILPLFPAHTCYVEPFCGAAAIFFLKEQSKVEVINDINDDLSCLYRVIKNHLEEFCRQFKYILVSRQIYSWLGDTPPHVLTDIQKAARFYYLQKMGFGGRVDGRTFGVATTSPPRLNLLRMEEDLSQAHLRLSRVYIESLDWLACVEKYDRPKTLHYFDPPYWQTEGYGVPFDYDQYEEMARIMRTMKGKSVLSINDHPDIRETFKDFPMKSVGINYTVGGAGKGANRRELIIQNW